MESLFTLRLARPADARVIESLIRDSVWGLAIGDYEDRQIELALLQTWGLDTQLITDQTYYVVEADNQLIACGGWSFRKTLFGNDARDRRDPESLDPKVDAARIRAFFVHPRFARRGLGSMIMDVCEHRALQRGFARLELMATLPGQRLYQRYGFVAGAAIDYPLDDAGSTEPMTIRFVPMHKQL